MLKKLALRVVQETGISTLWNASRDVHWLMVMKFTRMCAFGQSSLILALFLKALDISEQEIGVFMSATLIGDVVISFFLTLYADGLGRRKVLMYGALMMVMAGAVFAYSSNFYILILASIIGVISPGGNEIGPFKAVEESTLAHLVSMEQRADVYAWYGVLGGLGIATGSISAGWVIELCQKKFGLSLIDAYRFIYILYAAMGLFKFLGTVCLSSEIELKEKSDYETQPLLNSDPQNEQVKKNKSWITYFLPSISHESARIVVILSCLFFVDAFASSMSTMTWSSYYVAKKFSIDEGTLGSVFFVTSLVASAGSIVGSSISKRLGPLLTMVLTHLPSSTLLAFVPLPSTLALTMTVLVLRACTQSMDAAPRQVFLSAVVLKEERTAIMGWINVVKTLSQIAGPYVTGTLAGEGKQWIAFVLSGSLKVLYDLGILAFFMQVKLDRDANN